MLKRLFVLVVLAVFFVSCSSTRVANSSKGDKNSEARNYVVGTKVRQLLATAESYMGTPYKYGGVTRSGMDCSGFVSIVFQSQNIELPRISRDQATAGHKINIRAAVPGDLLFFAPGGGSRISHVGIVHDIGDDGTVYFIHASTSKGVVISSMDLKYWQNAFVTARRVL